MTADLHRAPTAGIIRPAEADTTTEALDRMVEWLNELPCCEDSPRDTSARCKNCERDVADTITTLRQQRDTFAATLDAGEDGHMWRFWAKQARETARIGDQFAADAARYKARAERAEAEVADLRARLSAAVDAEAVHALIGAALEQAASIAVDGEPDVSPITRHAIRNLDPAAREALAAIERRAEAKGMRAAADIVWDKQPQNYTCCVAAFLGRAILAAADRKEQGNG